MTNIKKSFKIYQRKPVFHDGVLNAEYFQCYADWTVKQTSRRRNVTCFNTGNMSVGYKS